MADEMTLRAIAHVRSDFSSKFGIPRQSGVVPELASRKHIEAIYALADEALSRALSCAKPAV